MQQGVRTGSRDWNADVIVILYGLRLLQAGAKRKSVTILKAFRTAHRPSAEDVRIVDRYKWGLARLSRDADGKLSFT